MLLIESDKFKMIEVQKRRQGQSSQKMKNSYWSLKYEKIVSISNVEQYQFWNAGTITDSRQTNTRHDKP